MTLTIQQRESILAKTQSLVAEKYFDPEFDNAAWQAIVTRNRPEIVGANNTADFEGAIGKVAVYDRILTSSQIAATYNAMFSN